MLNCNGDNCVTHCLETGSLEDKSFYQGCCWNIPIHWTDAAGILLKYELWHYDLMPSLVHIKEPVLWMPDAVSEESSPLTLARQPFSLTLHETTIVSVNLAKANSLTICWYNIIFQYKFFSWLTGRNPSLNGWVGASVIHCGSFGSISVTGKGDRAKVR